MGKRGSSREKFYQKSGSGNQEIRWMTGFCLLYKVLSAGKPVYIYLYDTNLL